MIVTHDRVSAVYALLCCLGISHFWNFLRDFYLQSLPLSACRVAKFL
jgi:hypothetical protein